MNKLNKKDLIYIRSIIDAISSISLKYWDNPDTGKVFDELEAASEHLLFACDIMETFEQELS